MDVTVFPSRLSGTISANPCKSYAQRAIAIAALTHGRSVLKRIGACADTQHALGIAAALGAQIDIDGEQVRVTGGRPLRSNRWFCGASGLCMRMFSAIAGLYAEEIIISAEDSLNTRPQDFVIHGLRALGVSVVANEGVTPLHIRGPMRNTAIQLDGSVSSQFLTGLLIALPLRDVDTQLEVLNPVSMPYLEITLSLQKTFGVDIEHDRYLRFDIQGNQKYVPAELPIPGDWSSMAFALVSAAIAGEVKVQGLDHPSLQADSMIFQMLDRCGANIYAGTDHVSVTPHTLHAFDADVTQCPDLAPPLTALAAYCPGTSIIRGVHRLRHKESDRAAVLENEWRKLQIDTRIQENMLVIKGGSVHAGDVDAHGDHRIAMALATTALGATGPVTIRGADCVAKSYPGFFDDLETLGATIRRHP